ncbi:MAG: chorismate synthase, partial [Verrucomicrobiota bacterium]|nr:chorismate synthase [Verrucomicrobiota bacterium]
MGNTFGHLFRITTWGESHGGGIGVVIDGCPPRIELSEADIQRELDRRRPGQSAIVTQRDEADRCQILSGVFEGKTLGTPISILVRNEDARPEAYQEIAQKFRPSHADFTYEAKYGIRNWQGGGRASAR